MSVEKSIATENYTSYLFFFFSGEGRQDPKVPMKDLSNLMTFKTVMKTLARVHQVWFIRMWETVVGQLKVCYNMVDCL